MTGRALIVVDVQNDFCEGGSLAVAGGAAVAAEVSAYLRTAETAYTAVVATLDWHIDPGTHFSDHPDFVDTWPVHCVVGSDGSRAHPLLEPTRIEAWFRKGEYQAAYSGFEGSTVEDDGSVTGLADWLSERGVESVDVVGIATDHCVRATALDAVRAGFATRVLLDLTVGVAPVSTRAALEQLGAAGAELVGVPRSPNLS